MLLDTRLQQIISFESHSRVGLYCLRLVGFYYFQIFSAELIDIGVRVAATYKIKANRYLS